MPSAAPVNGSEVCTGSGEHGSTERLTLTAQQLCLSEPQMGDSSTPIVRPRAGDDTQPHGKEQTVT